jgi:hypothetical protein
VGFIQLIDRTKLLRTVAELKFFKPLLRRHFSQKKVFDTALLLLLIDLVQTKARYLNFKIASQKATIL